LSASYSNSQNLDPVTGTELNFTGNVLNLGGSLPWTNTVTGNAGGVSGGNIPAYNPSTGNIIFGYTQATVSQSIAINNALATAGTGIQLSGYKYQWQINNDLTNGGGNRGTLTANVSLTGATGNVLESFNYDYNQNYPGFTTFSGTQLFANRYSTTTASALTVSFTGKDQNFWAGYYGPRVHVDDLSLLYSVDPCKTNPAYSSTCTGFNNVVNTNNLLDSTKGGSYLNQAFAINTALQSAGVGAMIHGFNYGFNYRVGQSFSGCTATNQDGSCSWYMNIPAYANATVSLTNSSNQTIHSKNYSFTGDGTSGSVSEKYLLPSSMNQSLLGTGRIVGSASGTNSSIEGAWATMIYTADPCVANPLYSSNCKGYAIAIENNLHHQVHQLQMLHSPQQWILRQGCQRMILHSPHLPLLLHLLLGVPPPPQPPNRHRAVHLPEKVHLHQLLIQIIHQQINLLLKVAVVNPKQVKLRQQVIAPANQVLV